MSAGQYSHTTRGTGTVLTAAIYNADHQNHITNLNPTMTGGYADSVSQYQLATDPGGVGTEILPANLAGEIERLRFAVRRIIGKSQWYTPPVVDLEALSLGTFQSLRVTGDLSPAQITADQNDYAPTGHASAFRFRINSDAARTITGLAGGVPGRIVEIVNIGAFSILLTNEDALSAAANRFLFGSHVTLFPGYSFHMQYDSISSRWRPMTTAQLDEHSIASFRDFSERASPSAPAANIARLYGVDVAGVTHMAYKRSDNTEILIPQPAAINTIINTTYAEYLNADLLGTIPADGTPPEITEGTEIISLPFALSSVSNIVRATFNGVAGFSTDGGVGIVALHRAGVTNALNVTWHRQDNDSATTREVSYSMQFQHVPGVLNPVYSIRAGISGGGSMRFNGTAAGGLFGSVSRATLVLEEIKQ